MAAESNELAFVHHIEGHELKLMNNLYIQWKDGEYCDLVIVAQDRSLSVHACVMTAFSPKIVALLSKQKLQNRVLNMNVIEVNFHYDVMESIVTAVYTGIFQPPAKLLNEVLLAAQWLKITEFIDAIKNYIDLPKQNNKSLLAENNCKDISQNTSSPTLNYSQETWSQETSDIQNTKQRADVSIPTVNLNLNSRRKKSFHNKNSAITKVPATGSTDEKMNSKNDWTEICFPNMSSDNITEQPETLTEDEDDDDDTDNNDEQMNVMKKRSSKTLKRKGCQSSEIVQSKRRNELSEPDDETDSKKTPQQKSSKKKIKENNAGLKSKKFDKKKRVKSFGFDQDEVIDNLKSPIKDEVHSDDTDKEDLGLIVDSVNFIKCYKCYAKFTSLDSYHSHIQDHPTFECDQCAQLFFSKFTLTKHVRSVHYGREYLLCRHCDFGARSQVELRKHAVSVHNDIKPFLCTYPGCTFTAVKHSQVLKHMIVHSDEKEFRCNKCNRTFLRQTGLESHQKACFQLQEFLCDLCGQSFNHVHSMRKHRRAIHFGEKPYKCSVCSNSFGDHRNLHRHMLIHENSFPYSCPVCTQQFRHSNSLKAHVAAKHKDHPENIPQNFSKESLGGASYKRILKNDLINAMTSRVAKDGARVTKKWSYKVKREILSPTVMFESAPFAGEFLAQPEDSSFDASSSNDLELAMEGARHGDGFTYNSKLVDLNGESRAVMEKNIGDISRLSSCDNASSCFQLRPQISPGTPGWTEMKSPYHAAGWQPSQPSLRPSSEFPTSSLIPSNNGVPMVSMSEFIEAHTSKAMPMYHLPHSQLSSQKLHQSSQQALEKFLSQNRTSMGKQKLVNVPKTFTATTTLDSKLPPNPASSQLPPNSFMKPSVTSASSKATSRWKEIGMEEAYPGYSGATQKCISDYRCYDAGSQLTPGVSASQIDNNLVLQGKNAVRMEQESGNGDKVTLGQVL